MGAANDVVMKSKVKKELEKKATADQRAALEDLITRYAEGGATALPSQRFNGNEAWFPSEKAPNKIRLQAFKPWKLRAYGFRRDLDGRSTFFITGIDPAKKQDRAKPEILNAAGKEAVRINDLLK
jgi:hypothetical protein